MENGTDLRRLQRKALLLDLTSKLAALLMEDGTEFDSLIELAFTRLDDYEKLNAAFPVSQKKSKAVKEFKKLSAKEVETLSRIQRNSYYMQLGGYLKREKEREKERKKAEKCKK